MHSIDPPLPKTVAEPSWELCIDQHFHAETGRTRFVWLRRAA
jgi:hypothetical protein